MLSNDFLDQRGSERERAIELKKNINDHLNDGWKYFLFPTEVMQKSHLTHCHTYNTLFFPVFFFLQVFHFS